MFMKVRAREHRFFKKKMSMFRFFIENWWRVPGLRKKIRNKKTTDFYFSGKNKQERNIRLKIKFEGVRGSARKI